MAGRSLKAKDPILTLHQWLGFLPQNRKKQKGTNTKITKSGPLLRYACEIDATRVKVRRMRNRLKPSKERSI